MFKPPEEFRFQEMLRRFREPGIRPSWLPPHTLLLAGKSTGVVFPDAGVRSVVVKFLDAFSNWINPIWVLLGSAFGLHALWKTVSRTTIVLYLFVTLTLAALSLRSALHESQRQQGQELRDQNQERREQKITSTQDALNAELQAFSQQQTIMAHDLTRLADLEKNANAMADVTARVTDLKDPGIQLLNKSSITAHTISFAPVLWNLELTGLNPYQIPSENGGFLKGHSAFLPSSLFDNRNFPLPKEGDRIFGYLSVDCVNCAHFTQVLDILSLCAGWLDCTDQRG
jgi:hypothetical protein